MYRGDLVIDGYNVLHAAGLARRSYGPGDFERARRALLRLISQQLSPRERERTTVVFDAGDRTLSPSPPQLVDDLLVIYADQERDADEAIERLIRENSAPRRLCVVSSDHRLQKAARRRRARFVDSEEFLRRLARRHTPGERRRHQVEPSAKQTGRLSPGEVEAWLRVFDDIDNRGERELPENSSPTETGSRQPSEDRDPSAEIDANPSQRSPSEEPFEGFSDEIDFWESRISDLWDDDPSTHD